MHAVVIGLIAGLGVAVSGAVMRRRDRQSDRSRAIGPDSSGGWRSPRVGLVRLPDGLFQAPELQGDEREVQRWPASHRARVLVRGGILVLTDRRVLFEPHKLDRALFTKSWSAALPAISDVNHDDVGVLSSGRGRRLRITVDDRADRFLIEDSGAVAAQIDKARQ